MGDQEGYNYAFWHLDLLSLFGQGVRVERGF